MKKIVVLALALALIATAFAGCTPSQFTKGVDVDENYPTDILDIYEDAIVFDSEARFEKVKLSMGTKDDIEDIVEYYNDFYEYKKISPVSEMLDDEEYTSVFRVEGYEFELDVSEAGGKYVEDLFENVIEISAKKMDEDSGDEKTDDPAAKDGKDPAMESDDSPVFMDGEEPVQKNVLEGETSLVTPEPGAWYSYSVFDAQGNPKYVDYTIYFEDDNNGTYHYFDYDTNEKMDLRFKYAVANGVLVINLENNVKLMYDAYYDNDNLHLINQYTDEEMYMKNWNKESGMTPNLTEFTAYGCWMSYPEGFSKPVILAIWEGGAGFVYNWLNDGASDHMMWEQKGSSMSFDVGTLYGENLTLSHRGNVLAAETETMGTLYFYRATSNTLAGTYEITQTNDGEVGTWEATLNYDGTASHRISGGGILTFNYDNSDWYINPLDGMLYAYIFGEYAAFSYYYNEMDMVLHEPTENLDYTFTKTK